MYMRWTFRWINIFAISAFLFFAACSGSKNSSTPISKPQINGEGTFSVFYHVDSPTQVSTVSVAEKANTAQLGKWTLEAGYAITREVPVSQLIFSSNREFVTVIGSPQIFQFEKLKPQDLKPSVISSIQSTIESICYGSPIGQSASISGTSYKELRILKNEDGSLFAKADSEKLGGTVTVDTFTNSSVFHISSFGDVTVSLLGQSATDPQFFQTTVSNSEWSAANNLYCHLNRSPIIAPPPSPSPSPGAASITYTLFATSYTYQGSALGGIGGANTLCNNRGTASGTVTENIPGKWKAVLSATGSNAVDRLILLPGYEVKTTSGDYLVVTGETLWRNLSVGVSDEYGASIANYPIQEAWTGMDANGLATGDTCSGWSGNGLGTYGFPMNGILWNNGSVGCTMPLHLLCINSTPPQV